MSSQVSSEETFNAASALSKLLQCGGIEPEEKKALDAALSAVWVIHDRVGSEEA